MKKYLYSYIKYIEENKKKVEPKEMLIKINFFQHERLIHLIVTLFYAMMFIVFLVLLILCILYLAKI